MRNSLEWQSIPIDQVKPYTTNARKHNKRKIQKLTKLIRHYGQVTPIIVDRDGVIIDGHAVWTAMRELGSGEIAAVIVANRTAPEIKALRLALNRMPQDAAWNNERLRKELEELKILSFDLELTGFETVEIDHRLEADVPKVDVIDGKEEIPRAQGPAITGVGDIWICGRHRLGCGDARDQAFVDKVRGALWATMCFVDPPFDGPIADFVPAKAGVQHGGSVKGTCDLNPDQLAALLIDSLTVLKQSATDGALIYACVNWRHIYELLNAGRQCSLELFNLCVWAKTNAGMRPLDGSEHELICVFRAGTTDPTNSVEFGGHGRNRSNLWTDRGKNSFGAGRDELLASHPTVKPVSMIADVIRDVTRRGDTVLDTFMGTGSSVMAAEATGRVAVGIDIAPFSVDVAIRRWQSRTRHDAAHHETGELFDDRTKRLAQAEEQHHGQ